MNEPGPPSKELTRAREFVKKRFKNPKEQHEVFNKRTLIEKASTTETPDDEVTIIVNGSDVSVNSKSLEFDQICEIVGISPSLFPTITFSNGPVISGFDSQGELTSNGVMSIKEGTIINIHTEIIPLDDQEKYLLSETDISHILNSILGEYWVIWPRNPRYKAQERFLALAENLGTNGHFKRAEEKP